MKRGVLAITTSLDGHSVAILTQEFSVLIHDKVKEQTFAVRPIDASFFEPGQITLESLMDTKKSTRGTYLADSYSLYVSNGATSIVVISATERLVATWTQSYT